jgi:hypothetical protein
MTVEMDSAKKKSSTFKILHKVSFWVRAEKFARNNQSATVSKSNIALGMSSL